MRRKKEILKETKKERKNKKAELILPYKSQLLSGWMGTGNYDFSYGS